MMTDQQKSAVDTVDTEEQEKTEIVMPNIQGLDLYTALTYIEKTGLETGNVYYEESEFGRSSIIHQSVPPGKSVPAGTRIDLRVAGNNPIKNLPSMYQAEDARNGDFLKRYLWIFYHIINDINIKLDNLDKFFRPMETPLLFLNWLSSWFSLNIDFPLPEEKTRTLLKEAIGLYQWRGTSAGIIRFLEIITGVRPEIIEHYTPVKEFVILDDRLVESPIIEKNGSPYNFTVLFPVPHDYFDLDTIKKIYMILKTEKPVYTQCYVQFKRIDERKKSDFQLLIDSDVVL